jgi:hypothetical protein
MLQIGSEQGGDRSRPRRHRNCRDEHDDAERDQTASECACLLELKAKSGCRGPGSS